VPELNLNIDMLSEKSRKSDESNGFADHNPKAGRVYKDAGCTYYSGRLVSGSGWNTSQFRATNTTMNRNLRAKDTFLNLFPQYRVFRDNKNSTMRKHFQYPSINVDGGKIQEIDRTYTHKKDRIKVYTEEMLKVQSMKRAL
jgi:hypothetical protein